VVVVAGGGIFDNSWDGLGWENVSGIFPTLTNQVVGKVVEIYDCRGILM